jgi:8-oxo-dGTP pyrophosphatase MutT (NUDIX family)
MDSVTGAVHVRAGLVEVAVLRHTRAAAPPVDFPFDVLTLRRAVGTRCTGAWELVHGSIEQDESPPLAALREVREETGLSVARLYSITVHPLYLHRFGSVQLSIVFAAVVVDAPDPVVLSAEHDTCAWRRPHEATAVLAWPRSHEVVRQVSHLLRSGDAGAVEDVLRIPIP